LFSFLHILIPYMVLTAVHHFLLAPLLQKKRWLYFVLTAVLLGLFSFYTYKKIPRPNPEREPSMPEFEAGQMPEMQAQGRPPKGGRGPVRPELMEIAVGVLLISGDLGLIAYNRMKQNERQMQELRAENLQQQLESLRYQINPHFFMNTLNNIQSLIMTDPDKAAEAVGEFSKLMRIVLYEGNEPTIPLAREQEYMRNYISLMRLRYPDSVKIEAAFPEECGDAVVPPLLMSSIIENAFKHGISYERNSFIKAGVELTGKTVLFRCVNSRHAEKDPSHHGIGLGNIHKRLNLLYGTGYAFRMDEKADTFEVLLEIPLFPKSASS